MSGARRQPIATEAIPFVAAFGRTVVNTDQAAEGPTHHLNADITGMMNDPAEQRQAAGED